MDRQILPKSSPSYSYDSSLRSSTIDPQDDPLVLRTTRLILKRGTLPRWAPKGVIKNTLSWVLEESEVELDLLDSLHSSAPSSSSQATNKLLSNNLGDATLIPPQGIPGRTMRVWTRNLDHTTAMAVTEGILIKETVAYPDQDPQSDIPGKGKGRALDVGSASQR